MTTIGDGSTRAFRSDDRQRMVMEPQLQLRYCAIDTTRPRFYTSKRKEASKVVVNTPWP